MASGRGSNFEAILKAVEVGRLDADVRILVVNRPDAAALHTARVRGVKTAIIDHRSFPSREAFDTQVVAILRAEQVALLALAGFDRVVTATLLNVFPDRVLNVHPALLPAFPGMDAQAQASRYGVTIAGATVHLVDEHVDHGAIVIQAAVPTLPDEAPETLRERILAQEHRIYPYAIQLFAEGRVSVEGRRVRIRGIEGSERAALVNPPLPPDF
jgi:phosphoribosylglycinamide formyltransferase-1